MQKVSATRTAKIAKIVLPHATTFGDRSADTGVKSSESFDSALDDVSSIEGVSEALSDIDPCIEVVDEESDSDVEEPRFKFAKNSSLSEADALKQQIRILEAAMYRRQWKSIDLERKIEASTKVLAEQRTLCAGRGDRVRELSQYRARLDEAIATLARDVLGESALQVRGSLLAEVAPMMRHFRQACHAALSPFQLFAGGGPFGLDALFEKLASIPCFFRFWQQSAAREGASGVLCRVKFLYASMDLDRVTSQAPLKQPSDLPLTPDEMKGLEATVRRHATRICSNLDLGQFRPPFLMDGNRLNLDGNRSLSGSGDGR